MVVEAIELEKEKLKVVLMNGGIVNTNEFAGKIGFNFIFTLV